jgi:hypothetical protein
MLVQIRDNSPENRRKSEAAFPSCFFTTEPVGDGTGLGLDTTNRIVQKT